MKIILVSAVALIDPDGRVLLAQRPEDMKKASLQRFIQDLMPAFA